MNKNSLQFITIESNSNLVSESVYNLALLFKEDERPKVVEIDSKYMGGKELCEHYNVDPSDGANCVIVEATKSNESQFVAVIIPVGYRADLNNKVRKHLNVKRVSLAPLEKVLEITKMEYGSMTPFGLPKEWKILVDDLFLAKENVIVGGGKQISKLLLPISTLKQLPNVEFIKDLSKPI